MIGDSVATLFKDDTRRERDKCCKSKDQQDAHRAPLFPLLLTAALRRTRGIGSTTFFMPWEGSARLIDQPETDEPQGSYQQITRSQARVDDRCGELGADDGDHENADDQHAFKHQLQRS